MPEKLRHVHERFGPAGVFGIVRDASSAAVSAALRDPAIGIDDMFGAPLEVCQKSVGAAVAETLDASGIELSAFLLGPAELGQDRRSHPGHSPRPARASSASKPKHRRGWPGRSTTQTSSRT